MTGQNSNPDQYPVEPEECLFCKALLPAAEIRAGRPRKFCDNKSKCKNAFYLSRELDSRKEEIRQLLRTRKRLGKKLKSISNRLFLLGWRSAGIISMNKDNGNRGPNEYK